MNEREFYICERCGNLIEKIYDSKVPVVCCGQKMTRLIPGTVEASVEKHVPVVAISGKEVKVTVGSVEHPMVAEHYIPWVYLQTSTGGQRRDLVPGDEPTAKFMVADGEIPVAAYAYCNLHGLWKTDF